MVSDFAKSDDRIEKAQSIERAAKSVDATTTALFKKAGCESIANNLQDLRNSEVALSSRLEDERLGRTGGPPGYGPLARGLENQVRKVKASISDLGATQLAAGC